MTGEKTELSLTIGTRTRFHTSLMISAGVRLGGGDELGSMLPKGEFRYPLNPFNPSSHPEEIMSAGHDIGPLVMEVIQSLI
jgi:hypothetical protein